jgi:hypothetical protein
MRNMDVSGMIVMYNFVVGVLVMLSSEKVGSYAGAFNNAYRERIVRLTHVSVFTFGSCVAALSGFIYIAWHIFRWGL